ncbi:MAG: thiol reductase thioredoxin [Methanobacteriota archaeon]|nr:MAG: thiol reductase thioredoxin [Euryarchaeota archaeon]
MILLESKKLERFIRQNHEKPVVALFHAEWCVYCKKLLVLLEKSEKKDAFWVSVILNSFDDETWEKYRIKTIPTIIIFYCGHEVHRREAKPGEGLREEDLATVNLKLENLA